MEEIPNFMRAIGYYPTEVEIDNIMNEIRYRHFATTGVLETSVGIVSVVMTISLLSIRWYSYICISIYIFIYSWQQLTKKPSFLLGWVGLSLINGGLIFFLIIFFRSFFVRFRVI